MHARSRTSLLLEGGAYFKHGQRLQEGELVENLKELATTYKQVRQEEKRKHQNSFKEQTRFRNQLIHYISLLHGVALGILRDDFDLCNIIVRSPSTHTPVLLLVPSLGSQTSGCSGKAPCSLYL
jgi:hypothetical protein